MNEDVAQENFVQAVNWIRGHVSVHFTPALVENVLFELHRENCEDVISDNYQ